MYAGGAIGLDWGSDGFGVDEVGFAAGTGVFGAVGFAGISAFGAEVVDLTIGAVALTIAVVMFFTLVAAAETAFVGFAFFLTSAKPSFQMSLSFTPRGERM